MADEPLASYDPGKSLCDEIRDLKARVIVLTDVIFQLTQKLGDQTGTLPNG